MNDWQKRAEAAERELEQRAGEYRAGMERGFDFACDALQHWASGFLDRRVADYLIAAASDLKANKRPILDRAIRAASIGAGDAPAATDPEGALHPPVRSQEGS